MKKLLKIFKIIPDVNLILGLLKYLCEGQKKYGTVTRYWIGSALYVFLSDPDDIEVSFLGTFFNIKFYSDSKTLWKGKLLFSF